MVRIALSESSGIAASFHSSPTTSSEAPSSSIVSCRYKMSFARERRSADRGLIVLETSRMCDPDLLRTFKRNPLPRDNSTFHGEPSRRST
jgi:hypothetical protein